MRFCDKLPKLRKNNNLSQEQLADRLGVSRQAVSKWESGSSYPDMDKMIQMCSILNCTLEDLLDDGVIGNNEVNNKNNDKNYLQSFLKTVTKVYNMFCSMTFTQKMKCLFEMAVIFLILFLFGSLILSFIESFLLRFLLDFKQIGRLFYEIIDNILSIVLIFIGIIIFAHLFKIRYLDYFVTIEDKNVSEQSIEQPVDKPKEKYPEDKDKKQNKIIIRDPKHSSSNIFNFLFKFVMFFFKVFVLFMSVFAIMSFLFFIVVLFISICHIGYGVLFVWISIALIGCIFVNYNILEIVYKFIVTKKQSTKRLFIVFMIGLVLIGGGIGLSITTVMQFDEIAYFSDDDYDLSYEKIEMKDNLVIDFYTGYDSVKYVIDDSSSNIKLEIKHLKNTDYFISSDDSYMYVTWDMNFKDAYDMVLKDLKNKKIRNYDSNNFIFITVTLSYDNYNKLNSNYKNYIEY